MTIEDSAVATAATTQTDAANPNATASTDSAVVEGQGEGKTADAIAAEADAKALADKADADAKAAEAVPEQYADFTLPEGYALDGDRKEYAVTLFKELGLSQAKAQKAIEAFCKADGENAEGRAAILATEAQAKRQAWGEQTKEALGDKYDATMGLCRLGFAAMDNDPEVMSAFEDEGWGNHPAMVRVFAKLGELSRGSGMKGVGGDAVASDRSSIPIEKRLYPNMN